MVSPSPEAFSLTAHFLQIPPSTPEYNSRSKIIAWQMDHRLQLVSFWDIKPGSRVLELGCGQGDCTVVLADAVGASGHVDAVDPGASDYGSPETLAEAQAHISSSPVGPRISFYLSTDPIAFLSSLPPDSKPYDYIILAHCIWYFESPSILSSTIQACIGKTKYIGVAEWSLRASLPASQPHVLTALLLASLEAKRKVPTSGNIRSVLSPKQILSNITATGGFKLEREETSVTNEGVLDGYWEVSYTLRTRDKALGRLEEQGVSEKELAAMSAMYDAVEASVGLLGKQQGLERMKSVRSMDFWVAKFEAV